MRNHNDRLILRCRWCAAVQEGTVTLSKQAGRSGNPGQAEVKAGLEKPGTAESFVPRRCPSVWELSGTLLGSVYLLVFLLPQRVALLTVQKGKSQPGD